MKNNRVLLIFGDFLFFFLNDGFIRQHWLVLGCHSSAFKNGYCLELHRVQNGLPHGIKANAILTTIYYSGQYMFTLQIYVKMGLYRTEVSFPVDANCYLEKQFLSKLEQWINIYPRWLAPNRGQINQKLKEKGQILAAKMHTCIIRCFMKIL